MAEDGGAMVAAPIPFSAILIMERTGEQLVAAASFGYSTYSRVCSEESGGSRSLVRREGSRKYS